MSGERPIPRPSEPDALAASGLANWRERLSSNLLFGSAVLHIAAVTAYVVTAAVVSPEVVGAVQLVGVLHYFASRASGHVRLRNWIFLATLLLELVLLGSHFAWAPAVVLVLVFGTVVGGILLGSSGAFAMPIGAFALLLVGAAAAYAGHQFDATTNQLDGRSWWRVTAVYAVLIIAIAFSVRQALDLLVNTRSEVVRALDLALSEREQLQATRALREATEASISDAQKQQTVAQLGGGIAHLLNNTLTVIRGAAEQLEEARRPETVQEVASVVSASVERAAQTMRNLLVFSRQDEPQVDPTTLDLKFVDRTLRDALPENVRLRWHLQRTPPVLVDPVRLQQLLYNLALNARDALADGGNVSVTTRVASVGEGATWIRDHEVAPGRYVELTVEDDGEGMAPQIVARACEPFFTTRDPTLHEGLGLFVAFGMVRQWGGALRIESTEGRGTRVTALLPAAPEGATPGDGTSEAPRPASEPAPRRPAMRPPRAIIDDWKEPTLTRAALLIGVAFGMSYVAHLLAGRVEDWSTSVLTPLFCATSLVAWRARRAPLVLRFLALVVSVFATTTASILANGYMVPAALAGHATAVLLVAVYMGSTATWVAIAASVVPFVVASQGPVFGYWNNGNVQLDDPVNWLRVAMILPAVVLVTSRLVLDVLRTVEAAVVQREQALRGLNQARREHEQEAQTLDATRTVAARAVRLEAAGKLAGSVAHDLNNALGGVLGWASLLADDPDPPKEDIREAIDAFNESADFASTLVLQFEPHGATDAHEAVATDIGNAVRWMRGVFKRLVRERIEVHTEIAEGCYAGISRNDLQRVLLNLAANARDAMPGGGTLRFRVRREDKTERAVVEIADTGIGMSDDTQRRAFEAFYTTKGRGQGTGLGLYSVSRIVQITGGTIDVESQIGIGTTFRLAWPLEQPPPIRTEAPVVRTGGRRGRILLAEDNEWVRSAMVRGLQRAGFEVVATVDGDDARAQLEASDGWEALCTDAIMPGYSSAKLIQDFQERYPGRPVVVCSGHLSAEVSAIIDAGDVRFLPKPFAPSALVNALSEELGRGR